jgi:hypothetical protein
MRHTGREVRKLFTLETQGLLISKQICIVERCLVHELQRLCDEKHGQNGQVNLPADSSDLIEDSQLQSIEIISQPNPK